ncbi:unnamed protein product, partial [Tetraodon nigroviridis]
IQDAAGKVLDRWTIMSREEEIITLQQFLRFGETKSIVELMAIQEKEGQAVTVPSSKTDSGIRTFIESNNRTRSPGLLTHLENSSPSSIHHFENIPNSLAFLLPFQYINPVSAPMLGLPPNGLPMEHSALRLREPSLPNQGEPVETSESEVSLSPFRTGQSPSRGAMGSLNNIEPKTEPSNRASPISPSPSSQQGQQQQSQQQTQQQQQVAASNNSVHLSEAGPMSHRLHSASHDMTTGSTDPTPKKKPRKSSMPVKIEKEVIDVAEEYEDKDDDDDDHLHHNHHHHHHQSDELIDVEEQQKHMMGGKGLDRERDNEGAEEAHLRKDMESKGHTSPSPHQPPIKIKEELNDPTYDMFCMGQYGLYNGGMAAAAATAATMAALHESFISSMGYGASPPKFPSSQSPEGDPRSSPDPKICYVCKKSFKSSYSMKLHYKNVHLKEMHVCTVAGCNAAFPSRRSRDRS